MVKAYEVVNTGAVMRPICRRASGAEVENPAHLRVY